jgi:2-keto-4-pentenoate hydratase
LCACEVGPTLKAPSPYSWRFTDASVSGVGGHPLHAIVWLSKHLALRGETLPGGSLILAGALTDAVPLLAGSHYSTRMDSLGTHCRRERERAPR